MDKLLCPSMMCASYENLQKDVKELEDAGIDIFHCDVMDGCFVPNFAMGLNDIKAIRACTNRLIDCHLMIEQPSSKIDLFIDAGVDLIYIHPESERYVTKTLAHIKEKGKYAGLVINPDTSVETIWEMLPLVDYVMVMTVNPGYAGQAFLQFTKDKIKKLLSYKEQFHFKVMIDGACSQEVIREYSNIGCDGFILGTSALFNKYKSYAETIQTIREG